MGAMFGFGAPRGRRVTGPTFELDWRTETPLDSRVTFSRSTTATRVNSAGLIESVAINTPRFDYDPATRAPLGLLIEAQRTNLILNSNNIAVWADSGSAPTVTPAAAIGPDGAMSLSKIEDTSTSDYQGKYIAAPIAADTKAYVVTFYLLKTTGGTSATFAVNADLTGGTTVYNQFRLNTDTGAVFGDPSRASVESFSDSLWKVTFRLTNNGTNTLFGMSVYPATSGNGTAADIHTATGFAHVGFFQVEEGVSATSYIPTTSAQVTRAADDVSMTGANFSSWFNPLEGTLVWDGDVGSIAASGSPALFYMREATWEHNIQMRHFGNAGGAYVTAATTQSLAAVVTPPPPQNQRFRAALAYGVDNFAACFNGATPVTDTSGPVPIGIDRIALGSYIGGGYINGHIRSLAYYATRKANGELQGTTAL